MDINGIPIAHGMEIEQCESRVPQEILRDTANNYFGPWEWDGSGPREIENVGPSKQVGRLLKDFVTTARQHDDELPWVWTNTTSNGSGCGSHAHLSFEQSDASEEEKIEGYTIAYNTAVELTPFLAPFWCFDWEDGFRSSVTQWADGNTTRLSQSTMERNLRSPSSRSYQSVTLNPPRSGGKPMTIELRLNENHPSFAFTGLTYLRRVMVKAMRDGWSPKIAGDRQRVLRDVYSKIYNAHRYDAGLVEAMKSTVSIRFEEGRGIPGSNQLEFENAWEVMEKIMSTNGVGPGSYLSRPKELVLAAGEDMAPEYGPQNNLSAIWRTMDDDFSWQCGPEVR